MLINISEIKERAGGILRDRFDHKFLNEDNPSFREFRRPRRTLRGSYIETWRPSSRIPEHKCAPVI
jgi:hypothetical protein